MTPTPLSTVVSPTQATTSSTSSSTTTTSNVVTTSTTTGATAEPSAGSIAHNPLTTCMTIAASLAQLVAAQGPPLTPPQCVAYVELLYHLPNSQLLTRVTAFDAREQRFAVASPPVPGRAFSTPERDVLSTSLVDHSSSQSSSSSLSDDNDESACTDDIVDEAVAEQKLDTENAQIWFQQV
jgi:hypothetical protein